jgi:hypothetical protein
MDIDGKWRIESCVNIKEIKKAAESAAFFIPYSLTGVVYYIYVRIFLK